MAAKNISYFDQVTHLMIDTKELTTNSFSNEGYNSKEH